MVLFDAVVKNIENISKNLEFLLKQPYPIVSFSSPVLCAFVYYTIDSFTFLILGLASLVYPASIIVDEYRMTEHAISIEKLGYSTNISGVVGIIHSIRLIAGILWYIALFSVIIAMLVLKTTSVVGIVALYSAFFISAFVLFDILSHFILTKDSEPD